MGSRRDFATNSVILKRCRSASSGFPAGAVSCPPSCSGKQHLFLGTALPGERAGQENSPVPGKGEVGDGEEGKGCFWER